MPKMSATDVQARRAEILNQLAEHSFMAVEDLSRLLEVSSVTIRRDLDALHAQGMLIRRHGGAMVSSNTPRPAEDARSYLGSESKEDVDVNDHATRRIASAVAELLNPGDVVLLSDGPISRQLSGILVNFHDLTVITNSVDVFDTLRNGRHIHLVTTGGELLHSQRTLVGPLAEASIREIRADKLILEPSGISRDGQLYCAGLSDVPVQQVMIHAAREILVVAEQAAFKKEGIMPVSSLDAAVCLITNASISEMENETLQREGLEIVRA